jgi:serine/threonine-protein kinase RsbW
MDALKLKIPSLVENVRIVESFIEDAKEKYSFNDDVYGNIMIAVTESVNNAIIHGNKCDKNKDVFISMNVMQKALKFTIKDQGTGFDIESLPDPTAPENLLKPGGRGIFLIKHLADEVEFEDCGRSVSMTFFLNEQ